MLQNTDYIYLPITDMFKSTTVEKSYNEIETVFTPGEWVLVEVS